MEEIITFFKEANDASADRHLFWAKFWGIISLAMFLFIIAQNIYKWIKRIFNKEE